MAPNISLSENSIDIDLSSIPSFDNDSLNHLWNYPNIEMLIISPDDINFVNELTPLLDWKNQKGVKTEILTNYSSYEGSDDAAKIRNMIKAYHNKHDIRWVLIAGDTDLIPIRYVYNPDVVVVGGGESEYLDWDDEYKPTDFYYASLEGTWDEDGDGNYGESSSYNSNEKDEIYWNPDVFVGRFPAGNAIELQTMVNKTLKYETNPLNGSWMNQMLLAGGISSYIPPEDESRLTQFIWQNYTINNMFFTHLIKNTSSFNPLKPPSPNIQDDLNRANFTKGIDLGYSTVIIAGHGDPTIINDASFSTYFTNNDAVNTNNQNMPSLFYADACSTSSYDMGDNSIGERMIKQNNAGAIGYIGGLRVTWYLDEDTSLEKLNRGNARLFWQQFFEEKKFQQGRALYDSKVKYLNSDYFLRGDTSIQLEWQRKNVLTYNLLGDPELDVYTSYPINVSDSLISKFYQGQLINTTVRDIEGNPVPYARVHVHTADGKYLTAYADKTGNVLLRLPSIIDESYNITITGHNLKPSYFNISTHRDMHPPELINAEVKPGLASVFENVQFDIKVTDNQSGIESVHILISSDNFNTYKRFSSYNSFLENSSKFKITASDLTPGDYEYAILLRDYSNQTKLFLDTSYILNIEFPVYLVIIIASSVFIVSLVGIYYYRRHKARKN